MTQQMFDKGIIVFGLTMYGMGIFTMVIYYYWDRPKKSITKEPGTTEANVLLYKLGSVHQANKRAFEEIKAFNDLYQRKINELDLALKNIDSELNRRKAVDIHPVEQ